MVIFGFLLVQKAKKVEKNRSKKSFYIGVALFFFFYGASKFIHYYGEIHMGFEHEYYHIVWKLGTVHTFLAFTFLIYAIEKNVVQQTKMIVQKVEEATQKKRIHEEKIKEALKKETLAKYGPFYYT